jgi:hypothetical protein
MQLKLSSILFCLFLLCCCAETNKEKKIINFSAKYEFEKLCIYSLNETRLPYDTVLFLNCQLTLFNDYPKVTADSTIFGFHIEKDGKEVLPVKPRYIIDMLCFKADTLSWIGIREGIIVDYKNHNPYKNTFLWQKIFASPNTVDTWLLNCAQKLKAEGKIRLK